METLIILPCLGLCVLQIEEWLVYIKPDACGLWDKLSCQEKQEGRDPTEEFPTMHFTPAEFLMFLFI